MFKKRNRLSHSEFEHFFNIGKKSHSPSFQLIYTPFDSLKVAVVVPKKIIKTSVGRNKLRRRLNHLLKNILNDKYGIYIFIVKRNPNPKLTDSIKKELTDLVGLSKKPS